MSPEKELFCKDCKHSFRRLQDLPEWWSGYEWRCRQVWVPEEIYHDPVTGPKRVPGNYKRCSMVRIHQSSQANKCGREGRLWEPKSKKYFFLQIKYSGK